MCHRPFRTGAKTRFFQLKWRYWLDIIFNFLDSLLGTEFMVFQFVFFESLIKRKRFFILIYYLEIWLKNSVDWGEGIRHPSSRVVLAQSFLLTYTYLYYHLEIILKALISLIFIRWTFIWSWFRYITVFLVLTSITALFSRVHHLIFSIYEF